MATDHEHTTPVQNDEHLSVSCLGDKVDEPPIVSNRSEEEEEDEQKLEEKKELEQERRGGRDVNEDDDSVVKSCQKVAEGESRQEEEEKSGREAPADDPSWTIAVGAFIIMFTINMVGPCFSIVFSSLLLSLRASSTTIGWLFNTLELMWCLAGQFLGPLVEEYGWRRVSLVCSVLFSWSVVLSAFATSAWFLLFSFSILGGICCGLLGALCFLIIPQYYTRRRGLANACMMTGVCTGHMVGPILAAFLQEEYGFFGATIILGGILLHSCVGSLLFRPSQVQGKPRQSKQIADPEVDAPDADEVTEDPERDKAVTSTSHKSGNGFIRVCYNSVTNLSILRSPRAAILAVGGMLTLNSWLNFLALMPFAVQAAGHPLQAASLCITVAGVCNLVVRLVVSLLSDLPKFSMRACYMTGTVVIAISTIAFSVAEDIRWQMAIMAGWGCGVGGYMGVFNLIIVHYMGLDNMASTMGATLLLIGAGFIVIGPTTGFIRDVTNSYAVSMWVLAGLAASCFILWVFMPAAVHYDRNKCHNTRQSGHP